MFKKLLDKSTAVFSKPWWVITVTLLITIFFAMQIPGLKLDNDLKNSLPPDLPARADYDYYESIFGSNTVVCIGFQREEGIFDPASLEYIREFSHNVQDMSRYIPRMNVAAILGLDSEELARTDIPESAKSYPEASALIDAMDMLPLAGEITPVNMNQKLEELRDFMSVKDNLTTQCMLGDELAEKVSAAIKSADMVEFYRGYLNPVEDVSGILDTDYITGENDKLVVEKLFTVKDSEGNPVSDPAVTPESLELLKSRIRSWSMYNGALVSFGADNPEKDERRFAENPDMTAVMIKLNPHIGIENRAMINSRIAKLLADDLGAEKPAKIGKGEYVMKKLPLKAGESLARPELQSLNYYIAGETVIVDQISSSMKNDLARLFPGVVIVIMLTLLFSFRNFDGVVYPMISVLFSTLWTLGAMAFFKVPINLVSTGLPVLLIATGSAYGIHLMNSYFIIGDTVRLTAMRNSIAQVGMAIVMAGLTTVAGFGSNITSQFVAIRNFGIFTALGVFFALVITIYVVPSIICVIPRPKKNYHFAEHEEANDWIASSLKGFSALVLNKGPLAASIFAVIITLCVYGVLRVNINMNTIDSFKANSPVAVADQVFNKKIAGTQPLSIVIETTLSPENAAAFEKLVNESQRDIPKVKGDDTKQKQALRALLDALKDCADYISVEKNRTSDATYLPDRVRACIGVLSQSIADARSVYEAAGKGLPPVIGALEQNISQFDAALASDEAREVTDPELLARLDELERYVRSDYPEISKILSVNTLLKKMNREMHNGDDGWYRLPETKQQLDDYLLLYSGDVSSLLNTKSGKNKTRMTFTIARQGTKYIEAFEKEILRFMNEKNGDFMKSQNVRATMTNVAHLASAANAIVIQGQVSSIVSSVVIVAVLLLIILGSLKLSLIAMIPIFFGILTNFGVMGLLGIDLNTATSLVASISVGVGVDYAIHFTNFFKNEILSGKRRDEAIHTTIMHTGRAIFYNVLSVTLGFLVLIFSEFVPINDFSILISVCMVATGLASLLVIPLVIKISCRADMKRV